MKDFFDEDFPLSEKQAREREEASAKESADLPVEAPAKDIFEEYEEKIIEAITAEVEMLPAVDEIPEAVEEPEVAQTASAKEFADIFDEPIESVDILAPVEVHEAYADSEADDYEEDIAVAEHLPDEEDEGYTFGEPVEYDPIEAAPILDLEDDEPLDDSFLPDAPIIIDEDFDPEADLDSEIEALNSKLDDMERAVEAMTKDLQEREEEEPTYEFDERYFAEEETPAFKYPEMVKKPKPRTVKKEQHLTVNISKENLKTAAKVGAAVAGVAIVAKLLGGKKK